MKRTTDTFNRTLDAIITIVFVFMLLCAIMQVFFRYVAQISVPWTEEAARFSLIMVTFWGAATALRDREHISIPTLLEKFPEKVRLTLQMAFIIAIGVFLGYAFIGSLEMVKLTYDTPVGSISWLTMGMVYLILPSGIILITVYLIGWMAVTFRLFFTSESSEKGAKE